jgi:KDO2-lipid IV(A) lauroyltransferase
MHAGPPFSWQSLQLTIYRAREGDALSWSSPPFIHRLEYAAVSALCSLLSLLPWRAARATADLIGEIGRLLDRPKRRRRAEANLCRALKMEEPQARRTIRRLYRHLAKMYVDALHVSRMEGRPGYSELFEYAGFEKLRPYAEGGVIFVSGHVGHWELLPRALSAREFRLWLVRRDLNNRLVDRRLNRLRGVQDRRALSKHGSILRMFRALVRGEAVGLLVDQDARRNGVFADFFGRPASTTVLPARLALRTGSPIAFVYMRKVPGENRFQAVCHDVINADPEAARESEIMRITERINADLETVIRSAPAQWLWLHRRWKTWPGKYADQQVSREPGATTGAPE